MKIIGYKKDYQTATLKTVRNCMKLCKVYGIDFYYSPVGNDKKVWDYYYHIGGTKELLDRLNVSMWNNPEEVKELLNKTPEEQIKSCAPNAQEKLKRIEAAVAAKKWTSNGDALFCELIGDFDTAEKVVKNRAEYRERQRQAQLEEEKRRENERLKELREKEQKRLEHLEKIRTLLRSEEFITSEEFEMIAADCKIALPIKLIGWLREYCSRIRIKKQPEPPHGLSWEHKYSTTYYYKQKGHTSKSIYKYADMLAEYLEL